MDDKWKDEEIFKRMKGRMKELMNKYPTSSCAVAGEDEWVNE